MIIVKALVKQLINKKLTITTVESCTGGAFASAITNIEKASEVISSSIVTYSNTSKIKYGVDPDIINKYTVYSIQVAEEMAKVGITHNNANISVGITGSLGRKDPNNKGSIPGEIYISIIYKRNHTIDITNINFNIDKNDRFLQKQIIVSNICTKILDILNYD